jgi:outer membrane protein assembly factor BamB
MCGTTLPPAPDVDWPALLGGPTRCAVVSRPASGRAGPGWRYVPDEGLGELRHSPVAAFGMVYVVTDEGQVEAIDQYSGKRVWRQKLREPPAGSPIVVGESLLLWTRDGELFVLDARRGGALSRVDVGYRPTGAPALVGHRAFVAADLPEGPALLAVDTDGDPSTPIWRYTGADATALGRTLAAPAAGGGAVVVADAGGAVHAVDAETGEARWTAKLGDGCPIHGSPSVAMESVFVANRDGLCARLDLASGERKGWAATRVAPPVYSSMAVMGRTAYLTSHAGIVYGFDARTGGELSATEVPRCAGWNSGLTSCVATPDYVFFGASSERVFAYHRASDWPSQVMQVDSPVIAPPALSDGALYVVSRGGLVYCTPEWRSSHGSS